MNVILRGTPPLGLGVNISHCCTKYVCNWQHNVNFFGGGGGGTGGGEDSDGRKFNSLNFV